MLNLAAPTEPAWAQLALEHIDDVLLDHAHCEKKAAGAALKLLFSHPQQVFLQLPLSRLAREELTHFEAVLGLLEKRGVAFERQRPSPYAGRLHTQIRSREPERLLDLLLVSALIEARSCERFKLLAEALEQHSESELAAFYRALLPSEARHHQAYLELCALAVGRGVRSRDGDQRVRSRLVELAEVEAAILTEPCAFVRLHT